MYLEKRLLIVDDSPIVRQVISNILAEAGYARVSLAPGGREAVGILASQPFDLVLLDYQMPEMNGVEVLEHIKANYPDMIVIMLSDQNDRNLVVELMRKADDYIVKDEGERVRGELLYAFDRCFAYQELVIKNRMLMADMSARNRKLEEELKMARNLQREIFPIKIEASSRFCIEVFSRPCETIGGDFFSIARLDTEHIGIFMGDICGHGIQAALLSFTLANALKTTLEQPDRLSAAATVRRLNSLLVQQFPTGSFATGSYLVLDENSDTITFSGAFETPVLHCLATGEFTEHTNGNIVFLGLVDNAMIVFEESVIAPAAGERIFIFTDGLVEVKNKELSRFKLERVKELILAHAHLPVKEVCQRLYDAAVQFSNGGISDDITIIGIEKK